MPFAVRLGPMGLIVCPSDVVDAPIERVWALVASTEGIDDWVDATLVSAERTARCELDRSYTSSPGP